MSRIAFVCAVSFAVFIVFAASASKVMADPDPALMVYPIGIATYYFNPEECKLVGPGETGYDAAYDRGGKVLIEKSSGKILKEVYQADPIGFKEEAYDKCEDNGYGAAASDFTLTIDCWANSATTFRHVYLYVSGEGSDLARFCGREDECQYELTVNGTPCQGQFSLGDIEVRTRQGNGYTGTVTVQIHWSGTCGFMTFGAYLDENHNGRRDESERKAPGSHDTTACESGPATPPLSTSPINWGTLKAIYR